MRKTFAIAALALMPCISLAQVNTQSSVQSLVRDVITFINTTLLPFLFAVALVIFAYYIVKYFIVDITDYDGRERARRYALYSILAFVLMVSIWGIVNLFVAGIGLGQDKAVCPDSVPEIMCEARGW